VDRLAIQRGSSAAAIAGTAHPAPAQEVLVLLFLSAPRLAESVVRARRWRYFQNFLHGTRPGAETPQDMERYIELHPRESRQNQNADPVTPAVAGQSPLRRLGASSIHGHGWTLSPHVGTSERANQYSSKVQQCPPLLSAVQRAFAHTNRA
jgi:hypothetical protein